MKLDFEEIDGEATPLGRLTLHRYRGEGGSGYEVRLDGAFLMATHGALGEVAMVDLAVARVACPEVALVGGLGAGHTLRRLVVEARLRRIHVVEIGSKVVEWNRSHFEPVLGPALDDPRVTVHVEDLAGHLKQSRARYDVMLLDVDNGPGWLAAASNAWLYEPAGLEATRRALRPGGVVAIWSPDPNPTLAQRLDDTFEAHEALATRTLMEDAPDTSVAAPTDLVYLAAR